MGVGSLKSRYRSAAGKPVLSPSRKPVHSPSGKPASSPSGERVPAHKGIVFIRLYPVVNREPRTRKALLFMITFCDRSRGFGHRCSGGLLPTGFARTHPEAH